MNVISDIVTLEPAFLNASSGGAILSTSAQAYTGASSAMFSYFSLGKWRIILSSR